MSEGLDLHSQVVASVVNEQFRIAEKIRIEQEAKLWEEDNRQILEGLQTAVAELAFPKMVAIERNLLLETPSYPREEDGQSEGMEIRQINWIPDNSEDTQKQSRQVRAITGHAVLLSPRREGVNGDFQEPNEDVRDCFYALGTAVEVDGSFMFCGLFAADVKRNSYASGNLYRDLTMHRYTFAVQAYNAAQRNAFWENFAFEPKEDNGYGLLIRGMERSFKRKMGEIAMETTQAVNAERSQAVNNVILHDATKDSASYREHLRPLVDVSKTEMNINRMILAYNFDTFLSESTIVQGWFKQ